MNKRLMYAGMAMMFLALASTSLAQSVVVGDFEGDLDGWYKDAGTLSFSATGATLGTQALQVDAAGGWKLDAKLDVKPHRALLGNKGVKVTADVTAFEADMTTSWMQVEIVINAQNNNDAGANNNIGWNGLGGQDVIRDGQPHTYTWTLPDALTAKIAAADDSIYWFEFALVSNLDGASVTKFYIDNIQISYEPPGASVLVSSFETGLEGWYDDNWTAGTIAVGATGATAGSQALQVEGPGGWQQLTKVNVKPYMAALSNKGVKITADVTAFAADMTTTWMQVGMVLNCQGDNNNGANNNLGWMDLGLQDLPRDGQAHTLTWTISDDRTAKIAGANDQIGWFEFLLISNVDAASTVKFYVDNVQIVGVPIPTGKSTDLVIGNWEQEMDGWTVGGEADVLFSDSNGVTLDKYALDVWVPTGAWATVLSLNLLDPNHADALAAFKQNTKVTVDVTHLAANWPADDIPGWNGKHLVINCGGDGWSLWQDFGYQAHWTRNDGDRTLTATWNYAPYLGQIKFDNLTWASLELIVNANDTNYEGPVWFYLDNMKLSGGGIALYPQPANSAKDVDINAQLRWTAGAFATKHHLYLGTSQAAVTNAEGASDPSVTFVEIDGTSFDPNDLKFNTQYFWRIDAVNDVNPDSPWKGSVLSFTTANFIVIDQFEQYTDNSDANEAIYQTWADGWTDEIFGGSQVGYTNPPFTEGTVIHGGSKAMPFQYDNSDKSYSEGKRTWTTPQDWTLNGYNTLKLYIQGKAGNGVDPLYLKVEDSAGKIATVTYPDTKVMTTEAWAEWLVPLATLTSAGVDVKAVTGLTIGVGKAGAASGSLGLLFIDDIQVGSKPYGLVAHYKFESNLDDSSGNGFNGTLAGDPNFPLTYVNGPTGFGKAVLFNGESGHQLVDLGTFNPSTATGQITVALWAKWDGLTTAWQGLMGKRWGAWSASGMMWQIEANQTTGVVRWQREGAGEVLIGSAAPAVGQWNHLAVTFDGTTARTYLNGAFVDDGAFSFGFDQAAPLVIGSSTGNGGNPYNGAIDDVYIYDKVLSEAEIKALAGK